MYAQTSVHLYTHVRSLVRSHVHSSVHWFALRLSPRPLATRTPYVHCVSWSYKSIVYEALKKLTHLFILHVLFASFRRRCFCISPISRYLFWFARDGIQISTDRYKDPVLSSVCVFVFVSCVTMKRSIPNNCPESETVTVFARGHTPSSTW